MVDRIPHCLWLIITCSHRSQEVVLTNSHYYRNVQNKAVPDRCRVGGPTKLLRAEIVERAAIHLSLNISIYCGYYCTAL